MMRLAAYGAHLNRHRVPVVVLGGGTCPVSTWEAVCHQLPGHPVYTLTMPTTDGREAPNLNDYLHAIDHTLASLALHKVIMMGTAMNAETALRYALMKSEQKGFDQINRIGALVLSGVSGDEPNLQQRSAWFEDAIGLLGSTRRSADLLYSQLADRTRKHPGMGSLIEQWSKETDRAQAAWELRAHIGRADIRQSLHLISVPVQLLYGTQDHSVTATQVEEVARQLCTTVHYLPDCAQLIQIDQPQRCAQAVAALAPFIES